MNNTHDGIELLIGKYKFKTVDFKQLNYFTGIHELIQVITMMKARMKGLMTAINVMPTEIIYSDESILNVIQNEANMLERHLDGFFEHVIHIDDSVKEEEINMLEELDIDSVSKLFMFASEILTIIEWTMLIALDEIFESETTFHKWIDEKVPHKAKEELDFDKLKVIYENIIKTFKSLDDEPEIDLSNMPTIGNA